MAEKLKSLLTRLEAQVVRLENIKVGGGGGGGGAGGAKALKLYDAYYTAHVKPFLATNEALGGEMKKIGAATKGSMDALRNMIDVACKSKKPLQPAFMELLKPINATVKNWDDLRFKGKRGDYYDHYSTMMEAMKCVQWVGIRDTPAKWVKEMYDQAMFWANKVLRNWRKKDTKHVDWVNQMKKMVLELEKYVKANHMTGLRWNPKGGAASAAKPSAAPAAGGPPPPPAPGGLDKLEIGKAKPVEGGGAADVFADISKGGFKLRKVKREEKTKYMKREDRNFKVPASAGQKKKPAKKGARVMKRKPPKFALEDGKKWMVEWQEGRKDLVIENVKRHHSVYIFRCEDCVVTIKGKVNTICFDKCVKSSVLLDDVVASLEVVNCQNVQLQVRGKVPTVSIDKSDGCQLFLAEASHKASIVVSKSSEMNLCPMKDGDYDEYAIPEQFVVTYNSATKKIKCVPSAI